MQNDRTRFVQVSATLYFFIRLFSVNAQDEFADLRLETRQIARKCFKRAVNCLLYEIVPLERRISYTEEQVN
jgi:hypothetical protein